MKKAAIYTAVEGSEITFSAEEADNAIFIPLKDLEMHSIGLVSPYLDSAMSVEIGDQFIGFRFHIATKNEPKEALVERLLTRKLAQNEKKNIFTPIDKVQKEIIDQLITDGDIDDKYFNVFFDKENLRYFVEGTRDQGEQAVAFLKERGVVRGAFELFKVEPVILQSLMTAYSLGERPLPFDGEDETPIWYLGTKTNLGEKAIFGGKTPSSHVKLTKIVSDDKTEVHNHINSGNTIHLMEIGHLVDFGEDTPEFYTTLDHTGYMSAHKFGGNLKFKKDPEAMPSANYVLEYVDTLPVVGQFFDILEDELATAKM